MLTGATSFTGMWFAEALVREGHEVVAAIRSEKAAYSGLRAERLERISGCCEPMWNMVFGSSPFLDMIASKGPFDVLCHHAAVVGQYKDPAFDAAGAAAANAHSLREVRSRRRDAGRARSVLTGS